MQSMETLRQGVSEEEIAETIEIVKNRKKSKKERK